MNFIELLRSVAADIFDPELSKSLSIAFFTWAGTFLWNKRSAQRKYGSCAGTYKGFLLQDRQLSSRQSSQAKVTYLHDNILSVHLSHDGGSRVWEGIITMETEDNGTITYRYTLPKADYEFGFKRCIWNRTEKALYLVGERIDGCNCEVLIKQSPVVNRGANDSAVVA